MVSPLTALIAAGVSIWLDDLSRERLRTGSLAELVASRHVSGATTNPSIFAKAISTGDAYQSEIEDLAARGVEVGEALRELTTHDVRAACDVLRPVYEATDGVNGRVSIEVDARLARDTDGNCRRHHCASSRRAASAIAGPSMPAHSRSSEPVPEPGMPRTARRSIARSSTPAAVRLSTTAEPSPPSGW